MAAPARYLRLARRVALWALAALVALLALIALTSWIGSAIPRNSGWEEPAPYDPDSVAIMVETNGIHTALVLPLVTPEKDWRVDFPASDIPASDRPYTHVSISWGEREVFLNTPTWGDLSPMTVLRIAGIGGEGLLHVAHYVRPAPSESSRPLRLRREEYRRLVSAIERSVLPRDQRARYEGYDPYDVFYDAPGRYTATNTCNQWTSNTLARAGVRTGWWTPFAGGVMQWVPNPER